MALAWALMLLPLLLILRSLPVSAAEPHRTSFEERLQAQIHAFIDGSDPAISDRLRGLVDTFLMSQQQPGNRHGDDEVAARAQRLVDAAGADLALAGASAAATAVAVAGHTSSHHGGGAAAATAAAAAAAAAAATGNAGHSAHPHGGAATADAAAHLKKDILLRQHKPFRERLQGLLPGDADGYVTTAEVAAAEPEILRFGIPRRTVVDLLADYVPVAWRGGDANNNLDACPHCILRLRQGHSIAKVLHASSVDPASIDAATRADAKAADVLANVACASTRAWR
jgi:hypothetical protein